MYAAPVLTAGCRPNRVGQHLAVERRSRASERAGPGSIVAPRSVNKLCQHIPARCFCRSTHSIKIIYRVFKWISGDLRRAPLWISHSGCVPVGAPPVPYRVSWTPSNPGGPTEPI